MPAFDYRARNSGGVEERGVITAQGAQEAASRLREKGFEVISVERCRGLKGLRPVLGTLVLSGVFTSFRQGRRPISFLKGRPKAVDYMFFCRQLATLLGAGVTLLHSLRVLAEQAEHPLLRERVQQSAELVEEGRSLADSFRRHGDVFPGYLVNMVEAGEAGGVLEGVMDRLAFHFERQHQLEQKLKSATTYPKFILSVVFVVVIFMLTVVLPNFASIFERFEVEMPALTWLLIRLGQGLVSHWYLVLLLAVAAVLLLMRLRRTARGTHLIDTLQLHLPLYSPIYRKVLLSRFCRTLGTLLVSGVLLLESLTIAKKVTGNSIIGRGIEKAREGVVNGQPLAEPLSEQGYFPSLVLEMVRVGEQTGSLDSMLLRLAEYYEAEVLYELERLNTVLEPLLILFMAFIVGVIVLSVLQPMLEIYQFM